MPTARGDALLQRLMPAPPVAMRSFPQDNDVLVFTEIYDRTGGPPHMVDIETLVRSADRKVVWTHTDERSSAELGGGSGGYGHTVRVPLGGLAPGSYTLTVEARSRLGQTATREVPFDVVPPTR